MRQRVGMAQAVLNKPKVLVLDKPSAYLDEREENLFYELAGEFFTKPHCDYYREKQFG